MRRLLFVVVLVVLAGGFLAWLMEQDSGYLLISYGNYSIDMSLWAALLILLLVSLLWRGLRMLLRAPGGLFQSWFNSSRERGRVQTARGLLQFVEGRWQQSMRTLKKSIKLSDAPLVNCLTAANAAYELGELDEARQLLMRADQLSTGSRFAADLLRAKLYLREEQYEEALPLLMRIYKSDPDHLQVLRLLAETYRVLGDWQNLEKLLPGFRRYKPFSEQQLAALEIEVYTQLLTDLVVEPVAGPDAKESSALVTLWEKMPSAARRSRRLMEVYVNCLQQAGDSRRAETLLRKVLKSEWDDALVRLYGIVEGGDVAKQLMLAESWLTKHGDNAHLLLTLGRLSQRNELWGKARDYLEGSLSVSAQPEVYAELARLTAQLGDHDKSAGYYRQGLLQSAAAAN